MQTDTVVTPPSGSTEINPEECDENNNTIKEVIKYIRTLSNESRGNVENKMNQQKITLETQKNKKVVSTKPVVKLLKLKPNPFDPSFEPLDSPLPSPAPVKLIKPKPAPKLIVKSKRSEYRMDDPFYYLDFLKWAKTQEFYFGEASDYKALDQLRDLLRPMLSRVIRVMSSGEFKMIIKSSKDDVLAMTKGSSLLKMALEYINYSYKKKKDNHFGDEGDDPKYETKYCSVGIGHIIQGDYDGYYINEIKNIPFHFDQPISLPSNVLNIFPGFKARYIPDFNENHMALLQPLFRHIFEAWAGSDPTLYKFYMTLLTHPIRTLSKANVGFALTGVEGTGKSIITTDFLIGHVYGEHLGLSVNGVDRILAKFNSILVGKMFVVVEEANPGSEKTVQSVFNSLKDMVTNKMINIEKKGKDTVQTTDVASYALNSNYSGSMSITKNNRRWFINQVDSKFQRNEAYFTCLRESILKQETGDAFYTYARNYTDVVSLENIPVTPIMKTLIKHSEIKPNLFMDELTGNSDDTPFQIPIDSIIIIPKKDGSFECFISTKKLHETYTQWSKENFQNTKLFSLASFSEEVGNYLKNNKITNFMERCSQYKNKYGHGYLFLEGAFDVVNIIKEELEVADKNDSYSPKTVNQVICPLRSILPN